MSRFLPRSASDNLNKSNADFIELDKQADNNIKALADKLNLKISDIKDIINSANDLDEIADKLSELNIDYDDVVKLMENIFTNSALFGASKNE